MEILFILLLLLLNGFFAMAEIAIISSRKNKLQQMVTQGDKSAEIALQLAQKPSNFLSSVQVGITLIGILAGALGEESLGRPISPLIQAIPFIGPYHEPLTFLIVISIITYLSLIIGELVPKRIALSNPEKIASLAAPLMKKVAEITHPVVFILSKSTESVFKLLRLKANTDSLVTEEEVRILIREGTEIGVFNKTEKELVERALRLDDLKVISLMTTRNEIEWFDINTFTKESIKQLGDYRHSRIIFCDGSIDKVAGIIHVRELFQHYLHNKQIDIKSLLKKPLLVPESMRALKVLELFRNSSMHLAMVIDEYGNMQGIITFNDILEALVGDIENRTKDEDPEIVKRNDGSLLLDGMVSLTELKKLLRISKLPREEFGIYQTLGGFVISYLDRIPRTGDQFKWQGYQFEVVDMDNHRVDKVIITQILPEKLN